MKFWIILEIDTIDYRMVQRDSSLQASQWHSVRTDALVLASAPELEHLAPEPEPNSGLSKLVIRKPLLDQDRTTLMVSENNRSRLTNVLGGA